MADDFARQLLDALYNPETQPPQQPSRPLREKLAGAAETAATLGSGLLASVPAGLAGLSQMIPTRGHRPSVNRAAQKVEDVQSALTYLPRGEAGQEYLEKTAGALGVLGAPAEFLGEQTLKLTGSPFLATTANVGLDPVNYIGIPGTGKALVSGTKAAGRTIAAAPRVAGEMASDLLMGQGRMEGQRGAIKMKGGNWLANEVEGVTEPLRQKTPGGYMDAGEALAEMRRVYPPETTNPDLLRRQEPMMRTLEASAALNNWIDKKLNRYIRNEMATPEDPVRKLAEQGILHFNPQADAFLRSEARDRRTGEGNQLGVTPLAKAWEDNSDLFIIPSRAEDFQSYSPLGGVKSNNPWLDKVPPETKVYEAASTGIDNLGFEHLIDELKNSIRPDSDLPAHLRWKPEDLEKVTMEQAVKRVHDINEYRAQKKAEANEVLARNPATATFKEYPTIPGTDLPNERGLAWKEIKPPEMSVELPQGWSEPVQKGNALQSKSVDGGIALGADLPDLIKNIYKRHPETPGNPRKALEEALKYEGDVMGHCVGGYCDDVLSGRTKIYSLRDNKGEPLVTIEVKPKTRSLTNRTDWFTSQPEDVQNRITTEALALEKSLGTGLEFGSRENWQKAFASVIDKNMGEELPAIEQIKGSGKKDRSQRLRIKETGYKNEPDAYLLPFVHDFVRSGNWSRVADLQNTGLRDMERTPNLREWLRSKGIETPRYVTEQEYGKYEGDFVLDRLGKKEGGSVHISDNPDTMALELQVGGIATAKRAAAKAAEKAVPPKLPRAEPKTKAEIEAIAQRMAPQLTGEYVRKSPESAITVAGKTKRQFEREKELPVKLTGEAPTPEQVGIESMKDKVAIGILGDPSITGRELESVGDIRLGLSSPQHGGPLYGMGRDEEFWASGKGAAQKVQNLAEEAGKQYDTDVLGKYIMMGPEGLNYALHFADANLQAIDTSKMTKRQIEEFNKLIRKGSPDSGPRPSFPGIEDKVDAYLQFAIDPKLRIHFNSLMQMPTVTEAFNLPSGQDIRFAITEPSLRDLERGVAGMSIGQMRPGAELTQSLHPTYEMDIPGKFMGSSKYPIPYELMFPDTVKAIRSNPRQAPHEFGSLGMVGPRQIIDQQMIDELKAYEEQIRKLTGKKKGGAVKKQAGGAIKAAVKAAKPTAEQAAKMAEQRAELVLRSRAMQELKDQFENLPQPPKGFLSSESILQRMDEIRRREATPSGEQIPLLKKGGAVEMQVGGAIKSMIKRVGDQFGSYEAKRLERAADEVKNLEKLYKEEALEKLFSGDNAKAIMTMRPEDFEKFSARLQFDPKAEKQFLFEPSYADQFPPNMTQEQYIRYLANVGGFQDIPFLSLNTTPPRKKPAPFVTGHEGRHRSRALVEAGQPTSIVQLFPDPMLRESMPRRYREDFINALNEELERTNRMVRPQREGADKKVRPLIQLPPAYKDGGSVKKGAKVKFTDNLDTMRLAVQKRK